MCAHLLAKLNFFKHSIWTTSKLLDLCTIYPWKALQYVLIITEGFPHLESMPRLINEENINLECSERKSFISFFRDFDTCERAVITECYHYSTIIKVCEWKKKSLRIDLGGNLCFWSLMVWMCSFRYSISRSSIFNFQTLIVRKISISYSFLWTILLFKIIQY